MLFEGYIGHVVIRHPGDWLTVLKDLGIHPVGLGRALSFLLSGEHTRIIITYA